MTQALKEPPTYTFGRRDRGGLLSASAPHRSCCSASGSRPSSPDCSWPDAQGGLIGFAVLTSMA